MCALVRVRLFPLLSHVYTWRRLLYIRGERTSGEVKINEEGEGERERDTKSNEKRERDEWRRI